MNEKTGVNVTKRVSLRKKPAFVCDKKYQQEAEYAESIPMSRWHNIELIWEGRRHRFQMNINAYYEPLVNIRLGHVFVVDPVGDEWVESPKNVLEQARADKHLMAKLTSDVNAIEGVRRMVDAEAVTKMSEPTIDEHEQGHD